jgi:hypothetical protein
VGVGGRDMRRDVGVDVMVTVGVVRRWVRRDWAPSRAVCRSVDSRSGRGSARSWDVAGKGFGSVVVRYAGLKVYGVGLVTWDERRVVGASAMAVSGMVIVLRVVVMLMRLNSRKLESGNA